MKIRLFLYIFIGYLATNVLCSSRSKRSAHDAPDYSLVVTDNIQRFVYVIAFIDRITAEIYHNDPETIRTAINRIFITANTYFYQINLRLIVADIILTGKEFETLQISNEYHNNLRKKHALPYHNFAIFFNSKIKYSLVWPGQLCRPYNGIHIPLNHYNPEEAGPEIFEEFAFLTNLSKKEATEALESCRCKSYYSRAKTSTKHDCLKIPGYPQNCSVQALADNLKTIDCLPTKLRTVEDDAKEGYSKDANDQSLSGLAVCGNGIIEDGETCDCGFKRYCLNEKHQKHCNQTNCLWNGQHAALEQLTYSDEKSSNCKCDFIKKVLNERCGKLRCELDYPIWIIHGVMYSITATLLFLFCCCFSCMYGRNPSKVYRQSIIFTFDDVKKPKHKPPPPPASAKPRPVIVVMRPSNPPPAPPTLPKPKILRPNLMSQQLPLPPQPKFQRKENPYDKVPMSPN
jgi:hypothetical protein